MLVLAFVAAMSTFDPGFAIRAGSVIAAIIALPDVVRFRVRAADVWAVGFAALTLMSTIWAQSASLAFRIGVDQFACSVLFIAIRIVVTDRRALGLSLVGYLAGCLWSIRLILKENTTAGLSLSYDAGPRLTIVGLNANYVAYALLGGVAVTLLARFLWPEATPLLLLAGIGCYAGVILTGTRGALVGAIALGVLWLTPRRLYRTALYVTAALVAALSIGIVTGLTDDRMRAAIHATAGREQGDLNNRLTIWPMARQAALARPVFGWGAGAFSGMNPLGIYAHDVWLDVAVGMGLLGIIAFVGLMWFAIFGEREGDEGARNLLHAVLLCAIGPPMLTGYWLQSPAAWVLIGLFSCAGIVTHDYVAKEPMNSAIRRPWTAGPRVDRMNSRPASPTARIRP